MACVASEIRWNGGAGNRQYLIGLPVFQVPVYPASSPIRMKRKPKLALRVNHDNPNHHLWNNRGVWWCHLTVHKPDATAERLRFSLKTRDVEQARERRDRIFRQIAEHYEIAA